MPENSYQKRKEYFLEYYKKYRKTTEFKKKRNAWERKYRKRSQNAEKVKAVKASSNAIRDGRLIPQPCVKCGVKITEAHHEDYSKPLEVIWLCRKHHLEIHRLIKMQGAAIKKQSK